MIRLFPLWVVLGCAAIVGELALRQWRRDFEGFAYRLAFGLCLVALLILVLGSASLRLAFVALLIVPVFGALVLSRTSRKTYDETATSNLSFSAVEWISLAACGLMLTLTLLASLAPVTGWDAVVAHLALPAAYVRDGRIDLVPGNNYSGYPQLMHCLYAFALSGGSEASTSCINWVFAALGCAFAFAMAKRIEGRAAGCIAAAIFATAPVFLDQGSAPSVDIPFVALTLAALNALLAWRQEQKVSWLVLAALLAGSACGVRQTAYLACVLLGAMVLVTSTQARLRNTMLFTMLVIAAAAPWMLRTAIITGNPVYPFFSSWLPTQDLPDVDAARVGVHESTRAVGLFGLLLFPWNVVMDPRPYGGWATSPGGLVLILGIPGLVLGGRETRRLAGFSAAGLACMYFFRRYARYLFPFFAPMAVVSAVAAMRMKSLRPLVTLVLVIGYACGLVPAAGLVAIKAKVLTGMESRDHYLADRVERYAAFHWVNENLSNSATILSLDPRGYFFHLPCYQNFEALKTLVGSSEAEQLAWLKRRGIRYVFYPEAYVLESPGFRETGVLDVLTGWQADTAHFTCIKTFELPRPRKSGTERIEVYEVNYAGEEKNGA